MVLVLDLAVMSKDAQVDQEVAVLGQITQVVQEHQDRDFKGAADKMVEPLTMLLDQVEVPVRQVFNLLLVPQVPQVLAARPL